MFLTSLLLAPLLGAAPEGVLLAVSWPVESSTHSIERRQSALDEELTSAQFPESLVITSSTTRACGEDLSCWIRRVSQEGADAQVLSIFRTTRQGVLVAQLVDLGVAERWLSRNPTASVGAELELAALALIGPERSAVNTSAAAEARLMAELVAQLPKPAPAAAITPLPVPVAVEPGYSAAWWGTMIGSGILAAAGATVIVYGLQAQPAGTEVCFSNTNSCKTTETWLRFGYPMNPAEVPLNGQPNGDGPMIMPLGLSLAGAGVLVGALTYFFPNEWPWWQTLVGLSAGFLGYGLAELTDPGSNFD